MAHTSTPVKFTALRWAIALAACVVIAYLSLRPTLPSADVPHFDKVMHAASYFCLGVLWIWADPRLPIWRVVVGLTLFGLGLEWAQGSLTANRQASLLDGLANFSGAALAGLAYSLWRARR